MKKDGRNSASADGSRVVVFFFFFFRLRLLPLYRPFDPSLGYANALLLMSPTQLRLTSCRNIIIVS